MKKTLLAVVVALAMVSCSQNEIDGIDNGKQDGRTEIKFSYTPITRATPITTSADFNTFTVSAYDATDLKVSTAAAVIDGGVFNKNGSVWESENDKKYYWPASGTISFFGYNAGTFKKPTATDKAPTLEYSIENNITNQKDLVVAQQNETKAGATGGAVTLSFKHALSQVRLKLKGDDNANLTYTITKIEIYNIFSEGSLDYSTYATNITWDTTGKTALATGSGYTIDYSSSNKVIDKDTTNGEIELTAADEIMILLPQTGTAKIAVTYSIKNSDNAILHKGDVATVIDQQIAWKAGMKYEYVLSLAPDELKISAEDPVDWAE